MTDAPPVEHAATPPLRRSREHKVISGVCGGLGRCFDMDPVIFRVVLGVLGVTGGLGLIAYGLAWLLIPLEGEDENEARRMLSGRVEGPALTAVLCALVGCGLFLSMLNNSGVMSFALLLLLAVTGSTYWSRHRRPDGAAEDERPDGAAEPGAHGMHKPPKAHRAHKTMEAPPETQAPPAFGSPSWWRDPAKDTAAATAIAHGTGYLWGPDDSPARAPYATGVAARTPAARPASPTTRHLGGWTFLLALAALGLGTGLTWHHRPLGTSLEIGLACALGVFGLGITVSSRYGRTGGGTIVAAVLTGALLTGAAALPKSVTADWTRSTWRPSDRAALRDHYALGTGVGTLDLTGVPWSRTAPDPGAAPVTVHAEVSAGQLRVVLPEDVTAELDIEVGVGDIRLPGEARDDVDVQPRRHQRTTLPPASGQPSHGTLKLELKAGVGQVEVTRVAS
ncbi:PspC domain-containing protein [Streptomyces sp. C36]|uniref:PspC domain-containing protein n=1 Tax=Streptomyces sp. C36 TaxID=3237122 RepID=UPI0034C6AD6B